MEQLLKRYGGILMFYLVIVGGVLLINLRFSKTNLNFSEKTTYIENKWFFLPSII